MAEWVYQGTNGPIAQGQGVRHHDVNASQKGASARLYNQVGDHISLWVYEVESGFEMAGTRAQSAQKRDFYPHNFVQPALKVRGQTANNYEFNRLSEFVRFAQRRGVFYGEHGLDRPTIDFVLFGNGVKTARGHKGEHQALKLEGIIPTIPRGARRFEFAHDYEFDFIVTKSVSGLMKDEEYRARKLLSWAEIVTPGSGGFVQRQNDDSGFTNDPDDNGVGRLLNYDHRVPRDPDLPQF